MTALVSKRHRPWFSAFALAAFLLRALIPPGFMPSGDGFFNLKMCPEGLSLRAQLQLDPHAMHRHHAGHDHQSWSSSHCQFAALASAPPASHSVSVSFVLDVISFSVLHEALLFPEADRFRIAQPRGPPFLV